MITIALIVVIALQAIIHLVERRDLYNRIMCRSIDEYKNLGDEKPESYTSAHKRVLQKWRKVGGDE